MEGTGQHFIQGQVHLMHCLVNAFPKQLGVATSNFAGAYVCDMMKRVLGNISCDLDTKVKVKNWVFAMVYRRLLLYLSFCLLIYLFWLGCST